MLKSSESILGETPPKQHDEKYILTKTTQTQNENLGIDTLPETDNFGPETLGSGWVGSDEFQPFGFRRSQVGTVDFPPRKLIREPQKIQ